MKPVNKNSADEYLRESVSGVDAVLKRMHKAAGGDWGSYAEVLDVSENTLKTWRRRGAVSLKYLEGFAKEHGVSIDFLLYGEKSPEAAKEAEKLSADERLLLDRYRASPPSLKDAALRVLLGDVPASTAGKRSQRMVFNGDVGGVQQVEGDYNQNGTTNFGGVKKKK